MSLVRIGMSENKGYGEGYDAIFGKRDKWAARPAAAEKVKPAEGDKAEPAEGEGRTEKR